MAHDTAVMSDKQTVSAFEGGEEHQMSLLKKAAGRRQALSSKAAVISKIVPSSDEDETSGEELSKLSSSAEPATEDLEMDLHESSSYTDLESTSQAQLASNEEPLVEGKQQQSAISKKPQKPRRRVATVAQRRAANIRERRRMFNLNAAFDRLRKKVPSFAYEKRLSRIETLKLAIMYIRFMDDLVNDDAYAEKYKQLTANSNLSSSATSGFLSSASYLSLYSQRGREDTPSPGQPLALGFHHPHSSTNSNLHHSQHQAASYVEISPRGMNQSGVHIQDKTNSKRSAGKTLLESGSGVSKKSMDSHLCEANPFRHQAGYLFEPSSNQNWQRQQQSCRAGVIQSASSSSPNSSTPAACCSSPASSTSVATSNTCHSTFNESPDSSPLVAQSPAAAANSAAFMDPKPLLYPHYPQLRPAHELPVYPQSYESSHNQESITSSYYTNSLAGGQQQSKLLCYKDHSEADLSSPMTNKPTADYQLLETAPSFHHSQNRHLDYQNRQKVPHQQAPYSLHSIEAR